MAAQPPGTSCTLRLWIPTNCLFGKKQGASNSPGTCPMQIASQSGQHALLLSMQRYLSEPRPASWSHVCLGAQQRKPPKGPACSQGSYACCPQPLQQPESWLWLCPAPPEINRVCQLQAACLFEQIDPSLFGFGLQVFLSPHLLPFLLLFSLLLFAGCLLFGRLILVLLCFL